jgi:tetratricopeptide (TPR) repeat protein
VQQALRQAIERVGAGALDEAQRLLEANRGAALRTAVGQNVRGDIHLRQGELEAALRAFDAAVRLTPAMPQAHSNRAAVLQEMGRLDEALAAAERALRLKPDHAMAHFNRGNALRVLGRHDEAIAAFDRALRAQPTFGEALLNRGLARIDGGKPLQALGDFSSLLAKSPQHVGALIGRATAFRSLADYPQALTAIHTARTLAPDDVDAVVTHFGILQDAERYDEALAVADGLSARLPEDGRAHTLRALALDKLQRWEAALAAVDRAVALSSGDPQPHVARAAILISLHRLEEAADELESARGLGADGATYHHAVAGLAEQRGDFDLARAAMKQVLARAPGNAAFHLNHAYLLLSLGDHAAGWVEHEWRLRVPSLSQPKMQAAAPAWKGEDVGGKKVLLYAEQGHGDTIQFTRYVRRVAARGAAVTLVVQEALRRLYEENFPDMDVASALGMRSAFDFQASLMSLAHIFGAMGEALPAEVPYLAANPSRSEKWRRRLGEGFKVGIVWQGNPKYKADRTRSFQPVEFRPLAEIPGVRLISLQTHGPADALKTLPPGMRVETLGEEVVNNPDGFREMAAVMANLDLLVTSDTGPAHLAGALARPIFVALSHKPDWRWMNTGTTTPWYPTMRLFRQEANGDWPGVFARIAEAVAAMAARRSV